MPRAARLQYEGAFYHVISRGNRQQPIFHQKADYRRFLDRLRIEVERYHFHLYAYVLMPNHFHLLLEQEDLPLSRFMQVLLTSHARWHNLRYQQNGHLFQGRYRALLCDKESYLLELTRYIHLNPVRAKIVKQPEAYPWSSYRAYLGREAGKALETGLVLGILDKREARARRQYEWFVLDALGEGSRPEFYSATEQLFLGDNEFVEDSKKRYRAVAKIQSGPPQKVTMQKILEAVSRITGIAVPLLVGRTEGQAEKSARELAVNICRGYFAFPLGQVAAALNRKPNTVSVIAKKLAEQSQKNRGLQTTLKKIIKSIK